MPNVPAYSEPTKAIGQLGLTTDLNEAYAQIAAITTWINAQTGTTTPTAEPQPLAPTNGIVDDTNNTFTFTPANTAS